MRESGFGDQPGLQSSGTRSLFGLHRSQTVLLFSSPLPLRRLDPTSIVDHPPQLLQSHDCNVALERPYACLFLHPLRTFSRRHASFPTPASVLLFSVLVLNTSLRPRITSFRWPTWLRCSPRCLDCLFVVVVALALVPSPPPSVSPALRAPSWPTAESLEPDPSRDFFS